jgi:hypothetical protein
MMRQVLVLLFLLIIGFALGTSKNSHVIVKRGPCRAYKSQPGRQEWVTAVEWKF